MKHQFLRYYAALLIISVQMTARFNIMNSCTNI